MTDARSSNQTIQETHQRIQASWDGWMQALDGIPAERMAEPGVVGDWSVKDVLGHVAFCDQQAVIGVRRRLAGEPDVNGDWQAENEREAAARKDHPVDTLWNEMIDAHNEVVATLQSTSDADDATVSNICDALKGDTYEHYDEHAAEVRAWRERTKL